MNLFHTKVELGNREIHIKAAWGHLLSTGLGFALGFVFVLYLMGHSIHNSGFMAIGCCLGFVLSYSISYYLSSWSRITISTSGVTGIGAFGKTITLSWNEIRDLGFSYCSGSGYEHYYCLYFADSMLPRLKRERVKFKQRRTAILFDERTYLLDGTDILAFCKQFTDVKPFTADPRNH